MGPYLRSLTLGALCLSYAAHAQEEARGEEGFERHHITLLLAHTHLSSGINADGERAWKVLPCWGLNYDHWITSKWAIGLHTDLITETFEVEEDLHDGGEHPVIERTRPVAPALMASFRPHRHWSFVAGAGAEFAREGDLFLLRGGAEYTIHLGGSWETAGSICYDARLQAYDSWTIGIGLTRAF